jgi:hypothetical protein
VLLALALSCDRKECDDCSTTTPDDPVDLSLPVPSGESRAGRLVDDAPTFGGISGEARPGDYLLVNAVARFVVQDVRPGNWYVFEGGGVIDADVVRPAGVPGRDAIEEWSTLFGLGRVFVPERIEVVSDGAEGGDAVVRVTGYDGPMGLVEGALEAPGFVPDLNLEITTEYRLPPDSHLLTVHTTATATTTSPLFAIGDIVLGADEVLNPFVPGVGMGDDDERPRSWNGYVSERNDVAYLLAAGPGAELSVTGYSLLTELASMIVGFGPTEVLPAGQSREWTRYWGAGPDLATLSAELLAARGEASQALEGVVTAPDGRVAGARVVVDLAGEPWTMAITDADGAFSAQVPPGATSYVVDGRGTGRFTDLPDGAAPISPYASPTPAALALKALQTGAPPVPASRGRGVAVGSLALGEPGQVVVRVTDGAPFAVRAAFTTADAPTDPARVQGRPDGLQAAGWARDGEVVLTVEPGTYSLLVHRGPRWETWSGEVTVAAGAVETVTPSLALALSPADWVLGDPHEHASPSPDGGIAMEDRLVLAAAHGLQVHFGTDHDNLADYRPLLAPLGLQGALRSVVADEVSPPLRGHFNIYPVEPVPGLAPNDGAWTWWLEVPETTDAMMTSLRARHGEDFILQSNHPMDSGMGWASGWSPGDVGDRDYWSDQVQAMEVMNDGEVGEYLDIWEDIVLRGGRVTPVAVSDAHSYFDGKYGFSATWIQVSGEVTDAKLAAAFREGRVLPTNGPFVSSNVIPGSTVDTGTVVSLVATGASYVHVDRVRWFEDGVEVEVVPAATASRTLTPARDALVYAIVEGDAPMAPASGLTPWALVGPWRVDVDGNGWTPPLPAFP